MYEQDMKALTSEQCRNKFFPNKEVLMKGKKWLRKTIALCAAAVLGAAAVPSGAQKPVAIGS